MGYWGSLFFSRKITQLEDFKKTLKDEKEIAKVQAVIDLLKEKEATGKDE